MAYHGRREWTEAEDATIRAMAHARASWNAIARALGVQASMVQERAFRLGVRYLFVELAPALGADQTTRERAPLAAGDPTSWDAIAVHTGQAGQPYRWISPLSTS